jgi:predicted small lipoprotein YifL
MRRLVALLILALPLVLGACGKKGPLRLPEPAPAPAGVPPAPAAAPDAEDEAK